jgi:hypothetical protein
MIKKTQKNIDPVCSVKKSSIPKYLSIPIENPAANTMKAIREAMRKAMVIVFPPSFSFFPGRR